MKTAAAFLDYLLTPVMLSGLGAVLLAAAVAAAVYRPVRQWYATRADASGAGGILFGANLLAGVSALLAARIAARIGLVRTMVFTHLPSNVLLILVPLFLLTRWFQVRSQQMFRATRTLSARLIVQFVETMTGIRAVKAFRKEGRNEKEYAEHVEGYRHANARVIQVFH